MKYELFASVLQLSYLNESRLHIAILVFKPLTVGPHNVKDLCLSLSQSLNQPPTSDWITLCIQLRLVIAKNGKDLEVWYISCSKNNV